MDAPVVTIFSPPVWAIVTVVIIPLIVFVGGVFWFWLRLIEGRVHVLAQAIARLDGRLSQVVQACRGLQDANQAPFDGDHDEQGGG